MVSTEQKVNERAARIRNSATRQSYARRRQDGASIMPEFGRRGVISGAAEAEASLSPQARAFLAAERGQPATPRPETRRMSAFESAALLQPVTAQPTKTLWLAYLLWWFAGPIGAHRFYLGAYQSGALMAALFVGGFAIALANAIAGAMLILFCLGWTLVDLFLIPGLRRRTVAPANGQALANVFS
jgi:TM2 domain-containing membrane protein YozV